MVNQKILQLADEAKNLIVEFRNEESKLGENCLNSIKVIEDGLVIYVDDIFDGEIEYELTDISSIFKLSMDGFGPCSPGFYEAFDIAISDLDCDYNKMSKNEFITHVGELYYMKFRCEEIYERLKEIESEATDLIK